MVREQMPQLHDSRNWVDKYIEHLCLSAWVFPLTIISIMEKSRISLRQILGELLLTAGAVLLLFAFYEAFWTNVESGKLQEQAQEQLDETWQNPRKQLNPKLGEAFARMYIPAFGEDFQFAIVEGTDDNDLLR